MNPSVVRILLVRHGESTGNRDHLWAGITDNELTNHGFLQAERLGAYLVKSLESSTIRGIFASDLKRAQRTAGAIGKATSHSFTLTPLLREQDLGWREGRSFKDGDKTMPDNQKAMASNPGESKEKMDVRARQFIRDFLEIHLSKETKSIETRHLEQASFNGDRVVIIVSHGLFLLRLYGRLTEHLGIPLPPPVMWSNTGCTQITIKNDGRASVTDINSIEHLKGLKRTRAGVGSSEYDTKQRKIHGFFKPTASQPGKTVSVKITTTKDDDVKLAQKRDEQSSPAAGRIEEVDNDDIAAAIRAIDAACDNA